MSQTINVPRELLERVIGEGSGAGLNAMRELRAILAAPRQPESEGLEVVAWISCDGLDDLKRGGSIARYVVPSYSGGAEIALCRLSDAQSVIAELREECELLRGECARLESKYERDVWGLNNEGDPIGGDHPSGFANDLLRVTIERDKLAGLLRDARLKMGYMLNYGEWYSPEELLERIDAALAEVKP